MQKFLVLSFLAMATALPQPIKLQPLVLPLQNEGAEIVPTLVHFVEAPLEEARGEVQISKVQIAETPIDVVEVIAVRVVDAPIETEADVDVAPFEEIAPIPVKFVDTPIEIAPLDEVAPSAVKFVDVPLEADVAAEEVVPTSVNFVDAPLAVVATKEVAAEEIAPVVPTSVLFVDAPIENAAVPTENEAPTPVRFVDVPLETPVKAADSAVEVAPTMVQFVNSDAQMPQKLYVNPLLR